MDNNEKKKKQKPKMSQRFRVVNIVAVMNCGFRIKLNKIWDDIYCEKVLEDKFERSYTYVKPKGAIRSVTIFYNGNMISVGNKSVKDAKQDLEATKKYLKKFKLKQKIPKSEGEGK
jgi:TATA-box binding protein (TBP) (component of TFIID and TFIIIB)